MGEPISTIASVITVVSSTWTIAVHVKQLVHSVRVKDGRAKDLEEMMETLTVILQKVLQSYEARTDHPLSSSEQEILRTVHKVVQRCKNDLKIFEPTLEKLLRRGNWVSMAWKQQDAAPAIARIEKSISERQQHLGLLLQLIQGLQLDEISRMLRTLTNGDPPPDSDATISQVTTLIGERELASQEDYEGFADMTGGNLGNQQSTGDDQDTVALLQAIKDGKYDIFESLLPSCNLSFEDGDGRNPLLLAAHLGNRDMVQTLLIDERYTRPELPSNGPSESIDFSSPENGTRRNHFSTTKSSKLTLDTTDKLGRTVLHYCALFGMDIAAATVLDSGVDVNTKDKGDYAPAYYAAKNGNDLTLELLLKRGAHTDFPRPNPTSNKIKIKDLLDKAQNGNS